MPTSDKVALIKGAEFENALLDAANVKKENLTSVKSRNKDNYTHLYDVMVTARTDVQAILDKRKKDRTDAETEYIKAFKKELSQAYRQICQLIAPEVLEDGELSKVQKLVQKVAPLVKLMQYIGHNELEDEFSKYGITLEYEKLSETNEAFANEHIQADIADAFERGKALREESDKNNEAIKSSIFETAVPAELQFDKSTNPTGIRSSDFCKLVDIKTKLMMAQSDEQKEKADEKANDLAGQCEFDSARIKLIQSKLIDLQLEEPPAPSAPAQENAPSPNDEDTSSGSVITFVDDGT